MNQIKDYPEKNMRKPHIRDAVSVRKLKQSKILLKRMIHEERIDGTGTLTARTVRKRFKPRIERNNVS